MSESIMFCRGLHTLMLMLHMLNEAPFCVAGTALQRL